MTVLYHINYTSCLHVYTSHCTILSTHYYTLPTPHYTTCHVMSCPVHTTPQYTTHDTTSHYTTLHYTPHHTTPHHTTPHHTTPHYTILHCIVVLHTTLHYTPHHTTLHRTARQCHCIDLFWKKIKVFTQSCFPFLCVLRVQASASVALVSMNQLPSKLNPIIRPIMASIKKEEDSLMQVATAPIEISFPPRFCSQFNWLFPGALSLNYHRLSDMSPGRLSHSLRT